MGSIALLEPTGAVVPTECACCRAVARASRVEIRRTDGAELIVPYCGECERHASAPSTRMLSATLASTLLSLSVAAAVPLIWEWIATPFYFSAVAVAALLPIGVAAGWREQPRAGHRVAGRAAWWRRDGALACANSVWAAVLAEANGLPVRAALLTEPWFSPWMSSGPLVALLVAPFFYLVHHPMVRIVNLSDALLEIWVDGRKITTVEATSAESPAAGVTLRLPAGHRRLEARASGGRSVLAGEVDVHSTREHLYAPGSTEYCFWLETTGYGRARADGPTIEPMVGAARFWTLPVNVDTWFRENLPPAQGDQRSTGGTLTAVRQAPCAQAPAAVRRAELGRAIEK
ncbi:MAG TPA: hypothetical protein VGJ84_15705 [Polyangiaceae bacterium]